MKGIEDNDCIALAKCIIGLMQAGKDWKKMAVEILKKVKFTGDNVDPCLHRKKE